MSSPAPGLTLGTKFIGPIATKKRETTARQLDVVELRPWHSSVRSSVFKEASEKKVMFGESRAGSGWNMLVIDLMVNVLDL